MKKHYVTRWTFERFVHVFTACGKDAYTLSGFSKRRATYRKNHVTCGNCRRTKVFKGVK